MNISYRQNKMKKPMVNNGTYIRVLKICCFSNLFTKVPLSKLKGLEVSLGVWGYSPKHPLHIPQARNFFKIYRFTIKMWNLSSVSMFALALKYCFKLFTIMWKWCPRRVATLNLYLYVQHSTISLNLGVSSDLFEKYRWM